MNEYVISNLEQQYKLDPTSRKVFLKLAEELRKGGAYDRAVEVCQEGLKHHPGALPGWVCLGRCYQEMNSFDEAENAYENVLNLAPDNARALDGLGAIYAETDRPERALRFLEALYLQSNDDAVLARIDELKARLESDGAAPDHDLDTAEVDVDAYLPEDDLDELGDFEDLDAFDDEDLAAVTDDFDLGMDFSAGVVGLDQDAASESTDDELSTSEIEEIEEIEDVDDQDLVEAGAGDAAYAFETDLDEMNFSPDETLEIAPPTELDVEDDDLLLEAPDEAEEDVVGLETVPITAIDPAALAEAASDDLESEFDDDVLQAPDELDETELSLEEIEPSEEVTSLAEADELEVDVVGEEPKDEIYLEFERAADSDEDEEVVETVIADGVNVNDAIYREFELAARDEKNDAEDAVDSEISAVIQALIIGPQTAYDHRLEHFKGAPEAFLALGVRHEKLDHYEVALSIYKNLWEKTKLEAAREHMERVRYRMAAESRNGKKIRYLSNWLDKIKGVYYV